MDGLRLAAAIRDRWPPIRLIVATRQAPPLKSELPSGNLFVPKLYKPDDILSAVRFKALPGHCLGPDAALGLATW